MKRSDRLRPVFPAAKGDRLKYRDCFACLGTEIHRRAFARYEGLSNTRRSLVRGHFQPVIFTQALTDDQELVWLVPPSAWRTGINELVLLFDRSVRPADVMRSSDTRLLSAAAYTLRLERLSPE